MSDLDKFIGDWNEARDAQVTLLKVELIAVKQSRDAIQAEVERLRKAGDAIFDDLPQTKAEWIRAKRDWLAAKGVQS